MPTYLENPAVAIGLERSVFIPTPKKDNAKECANYHTISLISHTRKLMLKILQVASTVVNWELPDVQAIFREQVANICWIIEKTFQKNICFCFMDFAKVFDCVDHNKLWKILKEMGIRDHLTCLLRNLHIGQEATVRNGHGTWTGSKIGKQYIKAIYCHPPYLTNMWRTSCRMLDCMKHKLESRLPGEVSTISDTKMTPPLGQKAERN